MKKLIKYDNFKINERYHISQDVKHLTNLIYNKIYQLVPNLILKKEIVIENLLQDNYGRLNFKSDKIKVKLGKNHGSINDPIIIDDVIDGLIIELSVNLSNQELTQKKLINNKVRESINHECQHIIEIYHSDGNLSKSWDFNKRLKRHEDKFDNKEWLDVCYLFYLAEEHELRSKVSQSLELLKNGQDLYNSDLYKSIDLLTKLDSDVILSKMDKYDEFGIILIDFIKNVLLRKGDYIKILKSYIKDINRLSSIYKNKMLRVLYSYENPGSFLEKNEERDIIYSEYIIDEKVEKRNDKIDKIIKKEELKSENK
jgi:hypothetical protein